jgi:K+-sensing histidine kinase KdpD
MEPALFIDADPQLLTSAVMNLLYNAFKNTPSGDHVVLRARAETLRVLVEVEDECGGIPQGKSDLFSGVRRPARQRSIRPWPGAFDRSEGGQGARR